eukprot:1734457-Rhodomonas_salina.1
MRQNAIQIADSRRDMRCVLRVFDFWASTLPDTAASEFRTDVMEWSPLLSPWDPQTFATPHPNTFATPPLIPSRFPADTSHILRLPLGFLIAPFSASPAASTMLTQHDSDVQNAGVEQDANSPSPASSLEVNDNHDEEDGGDGDVNDNADGSHDDGTERQREDEDDSKTGDGEHGDSEGEKDNEGSEEAGVETSTSESSNEYLLSIAAANEEVRRLQGVVAELSKLLQPSRWGRSSPEHDNHRLQITGRRAAMGSESVSSKDVSDGEQEAVVERGQEMDMEWFAAVQDMVGLSRAADTLRSAVQEQVHERDLLREQCKLCVKSLQESDTGSFVVSELTQKLQDGLIEAMDPIKAARWLLEVVSDAASQRMTEGIRNAEEVLRLERESEREMQDRNEEDREQERVLKQMVESMDSLTRDVERVRVEMSRWQRRSEDGRAAQNDSLEVLHIAAEQRVALFHAASRLESLSQSQRDLTAVLEHKDAEIVWLEQCCAWLLRCNQVPVPRQSVPAMPNLRQSHASDSSRLPARQQQRAPTEQSAHAILYSAPNQASQPQETS